MLNQPFRKVIWLYTLSRNTRISTHVLAGKQIIATLVYFLKNLLIKTNISYCQFLQEVYGDFDSDCTEFIHQFVENCHFEILSFPIHEHRTALIYLDLFKFLLSVFYSFQCISLQCFIGLFVNIWFFLLPVNHLLNFIFRYFIASI